MSNKLTLDELKVLEEIVEHNRKQVFLADGDQSNAEDLIHCLNDEFAVYDVFFDETMIHEVDPVDYYGYDNIKKMIKEWIEVN